MDRRTFFAATFPFGKKKKQKKDELHPVIQAPVIFLDLTDDFAEAYNSFMKYNRNLSPMSPNYKAQRADAWHIRQIDQKYISLKKYLGV